MTEDTLLLATEGLTKSFMGQPALSNLDLRIAAGEARGVIGHNGSGKSTLIKILAGVYRPDSGSVSVDGVELRSGDPLSSRRAGLRFIHQDLGLVDSLTVLENLRLGTSEWATAIGWRIRWGAEGREARRLFDRFDLDLDPSLPVSDLSPVKRTQLAIVRALQDEENARLLVLDEPTATLPDAEVKQLFELLRRVRERGVSILYVSHRLEELFDLCGAVSVLRDGILVAEAQIGELSYDRLVELIVGEKQDHAKGNVVRTEVSKGPARLEAKELRGGSIRQLSFSANVGEVVGLAGLAGSGVNDFAGLVAGEVECTGGQLIVDDAEVRRLETGDLLRRGVAVLPAARKLKALDTMTVRENLTLTDLSEAWKGGWFRHGLERRLVMGLIDQYNIRPRDSEKMLGTLSGGNRQKVCVAKWLRTAPQVLVVDEPTAGVDVEGRAQILKLLRDAAAEGMTVIVSSSDLEDLDQVCDRVVIVRNGRAADELVGAAINRETITTECYRSESNGQ